MKVPHFELQAEYRKDKSQTAWTRCNKYDRWTRVSDPQWNVMREYHIGPTPPPDPPRMCELGGLQFPMPESVSPAIGADYYVASIEGTAQIVWRDLPWQISALAMKVVHSNCEAAEQHSAAMRAANLQAVENTK